MFDLYDQACVQNYRESRVLVKMLTEVLCKVTSVRDCLMVIFYVISEIVKFNEISPIDQ